MRSAVGPLIRERRDRARRSQMDLAFDVGVSPRHLSFVELGKSRPSPELVVLIAQHLDVPLRERNDWLLAAGHASRYGEARLDGPALAQVRRSLQALLDAHEPFPAVVIDRGWTVQLTNRAAIRLADGIPGDVRGVPTNIFRVSLHPDGFAGRTRNFAEWSAYLLRQLDTAVARTRAPELVALADEVAAWPHIPPREVWGRPAAVPAADVVVPWRVESQGEELSLFTTMSTFGTADVTLDELSIELFFAADETTEAALHRSAAPPRITSTDGP